MRPGLRYIIAGVNCGEVFIAVDGKVIRAEIGAHINGRKAIRHAPGAHVPQQLMAALLQSVRARPGGQRTEKTLAA